MTAWKAWGNVSECVSFLSVFSPTSPHFLCFSLSVYACVCMKCVRCFAGGSYEGTKQPRPEVRSPDKAIDRGIKVTIECLQHTELIHSRCLICSTWLSWRTLAAHWGASWCKLALQTVSQIYSVAHTRTGATTNWCSPAGNPGGIGGRAEQFWGREITAVLLE